MLFKRYANSCGKTRICIAVQIGSITSKERSDILMQDFEEIERTWCPRCGPDWL